MNYTTEQIEQWKAKAEKWDALEERIGKCYGDYEGGEELPSEFENEVGRQPDLGDIGEIAARAFKFI